MKTLLRFTLALAFALVTTSAPAATRIWDGGGANGFWTSVANWSNNAAPANGDALVFPNGVTRLLATNAPGGPTNFSSLMLAGNGYVLVSSTLSLTNGLVCSGGVFGGANANTLRAPVALRASQIWSVAPRNTLVVQSNVGFSPHTLTLEVDGSLKGNGNFFGGLTNTAAASHTVELPLQLAASQSWFLNGGILEFTGPLSGDSALALVREGAGTLNLSGALPNSFRGRIEIRAGVLNLAKTDGVTAVAGPLSLTADALPTTLQVLASGQFNLSPPVTAVSQGPLPARVVCISGSGSNRIGTLTLSGGQCDVREAASLQLDGDLNAAEPKVSHLVFTLASSDAAPKLVVSGRVNLGNASLNVQGRSLDLGTTLVAIRNDGSSPVNGVFLGLPESARLTNAPYVFQISYVGGDGNDVVLTVATNVLPTGIARVWDGGGANGFWQTRGNWSADLAPAEGDRLVFSGNARRVNTNNFPPGAIFDTVALLSTNTYTLRGNSLRLLHGLENSGGPNRLLDLPVELIASQTWLITTGVVSVPGPLSGVSGLTLTQEGEGKLNFIGGESSRFNGTLIVRGSEATFAKNSGVPAATGPVILQATDRLATLLVFEAGQFSNSPPVTLLGNANKFARIAFRSGTNRLGKLSLDASRIQVDAGAALHIQGDLDTTGPLLSTFVLAFDATNAAAPKLTVAGRGNLTAGQLLLNAGTVAPGVPLTVLRNDGPGAIQGTFSDLPEGALVVSGALTFRISYVGGDGNDVVLLPSATPATIVGLAPLPNGAKQLTALCVPEWSYVLEVTPNLNPPVVWLPILTNSADAAGNVRFVDASSTNSPIRFYRMRSQEGSGERGSNEPPQLAPFP